VNTLTLPQPSTVAATTAAHPQAGFVSSALVVAIRTLRTFIRSPQLVVVGTVQGALFLLIFRYVFGGAIGDYHGVSYVDYMVPGYIVTGVLFSGMAAAAGVAEDSARGVVDRLRSLPIPRVSLAAGRALAETLLVVWGTVITAAIGFAVGFRPAGSVADTAVAFGLTVLYGFAFTWLFILIGLFAGSAQAAQGISMFVFPLTFVSSAYVPVESMPGWMQAFARNQPLSAMVDSVRAWVVGDPVATLGHSAGYFTLRAVAWAIAIVAALAPLATARYSRSS
jgi:ABC-2 type transport system permease protein